MNRCRRLPFLIAALLVCLTSDRVGGAAPDSSQSLHFRNGDSLKGRLISMRPTEGLQWMRPEQQQPLQFSTTNIAEIFLGPRPAADATDVPARTLVQLVNGDELIGSLVSFTNGTVLLDTSYAGRLAIPRKSVAGLLPRTLDDSVVIDGIRDLDTWTQGDMSAVNGIPIGRWQFHNGSLFSGAASSIAKNLNLPFDIRMDFELHWSDLFSLAIGLHTDSLEPISLNARELEPDFSPFYSLWISPTATQLRVVPKVGPIRELGSVFMRLPPGTNHVAFTVFASQRRNSVSLMAAGQMIHEWLDPAGWSAGGKGLRFVHQGYGNVRISNLRITRWDGKTMAPTTVPRNPTVDVLLVNQASAIGGQLTGFTNGVFHFSTGGQVRQVPFAGLTHAAFATQGQSSPIPDDRHIQISFHGLGRLTGNLTSWDNGSAILEVPEIGTLKLSTQALGRIRFPRLRPATTPQN